MNLFDLGQSLKEARIRQQLTQGELAERTGVSLSSISGFERGILAEIGVVKLLQLFAAVGLELHTRPAGQRRTLDDAKQEQRVGLGLPIVIQQAPSQFVVTRGERLSVTPTNTTNQGKLNLQKDSVARQRVRHSKKRERHE
ncbi:helix-turn-helix domain-containing protein [Undibacterium sp. Ji22W]|uniref:helix-turn-helix domain-containing protein n=1 Tax=Undibacterium sp. Ji22W TaxID=3413038 RepID=UPI003BF0FC27